MLDKYYDNAIKDAVSSLKNEGIIIIPTDTVYGLAALSSSKEAIERIYLAKGRDKNKLLPLIVNSYDMLLRVLDINIDYVKKLSKFYPGPLTLVGKRNPNFDYYNSATVAVRMINLALVNKIISEVNEPLALTSANISNTGNVSDPSELLDIFDGYVECAFFGGNLSNEASTIVEIDENGNLKLIREGKIPFLKVKEEYERN